MSIVAAYITVILIWSTTPLALQWSGQGVGPLFGVTGRMVISLGVCAVLLWILRIKVRVDRAAVITMVAGGAGLFLSMTLAYYAVQQMPTGWVSVIFGLTPIFTGVAAHFTLGDRLTGYRIGGAAIGLTGLAAIFVAGGDAVHLRAFPVALVVGAVAIQSTTSVWVKKYSTAMHPLASVTGGLSVAVPLYILTWALVDGQWPEIIPWKAAASILYLGVVGSALGFSLYFFLLKRCSAGRVALITLVTPISALLLGQALNGERVTANIVYGCVLILSGLVCYEWGGRLTLALRHGLAGLGTSKSAEMTRRQGGEPRTDALQNEG